MAKENSILRMLSELELDIKCQPVVEYLIALGLDEFHLRKIARKRKACFYVKFTKVKERLDYLRSIGVKDEDMRKVITKHPQVLEYTIERMMKPRIQYLQSIGVPETRMGRVITVSPSLLECSLEGSLKRRVRFLIEEVGVSKDDVWKIVLLSPQVLTQSIEGALRPRMNFLLKKLGISHERVAKMITKHPQLLHYSISNGIQPRIDFLTSIGMSDPDVATILCRSSQVRNRHDFLSYHHLAAGTCTDRHRCRLTHIPRHTQTTHLPRGRHRDIHASMHMHMHRHIQVHAHIGIHVHIHIHTQMHIQIHIQIHELVCIIHNSIGFKYPCSMKDIPLALGLRTKIGISLFAE